MASRIKGYKTRQGRMVHGVAEAVLKSRQVTRYKGQIQLILTSPPYPLNRKKKYGNLKGEEYIEWIASFAISFRELLAPRGSIVIELGNSWEPGRPAMSTLALRALLGFLDKGRLTLCQQFVAYNPARLPSPAQWVNVERIRLKDSFTYVWWMAPNDKPFADNRKVLTPYSTAMLKLLDRGKYNSGRRPSEHRIGRTSFLHRNGGAIPSNVLTFANTNSTEDYQEYCRRKNLVKHPARMPYGLAEFFIKLLTRPGDLVLDPFAGSNTTGAAAENLGRRWLAVEAQSAYVRGSRGRFDL